MRASSGWARHAAETSRVAEKALLIGAHCIASPAWGRDLAAAMGRAALALEGGHGFIAARRVIERQLFAGANIPHGQQIQAAIGGVRVAGMILRRPLVGS